MPTYVYRCKACSAEFEELQSISENLLTRCPSCGKDTLSRIIGGGAGLVFKGSGFYLTDYKKSGSGTSSAPPSGSETKKDSPAESKPSGGTAAPGKDAPAKP